MRYIVLCVFLTGCASISLTEKRMTLMQIDDHSRLTLKKIKGVRSIVYERKF